MSIDDLFAGWIDAAIEDVISRTHEDKKASGITH